MSMSIPVDSGTVGLMVTLFLAWAGFQFGSLKWLMDRYQAHIDRRFSHLEAKTGEAQQKWSALERELLQLKATLPVEYVRREDWIRFASILDAKLDRMTVKIDEIRSDNGHREGSA